MVKDIINNQNITIMAYYVKCNDKTYQYIGAPTERVALEDGNHLAWQADFSKFPEWPDLRTIAAKTGSLLLSPSEAPTEPSDKSAQSDESDTPANEEGGSE